MRAIVVADRERPDSKLGPIGVLLFGLVVLVNRAQRAVAQRCCRVGISRIIMWAVVVVDVDGDRIVQAVVIFVDFADVQLAFSCVALRATHTMIEPLPPR